MARSEYNQAMDNRSSSRRSGGDSYMRPTTSAGAKKRVANKRATAAKKRTR